MSNRQRYHISARTDGDAIQVREQLNRAVDLPTTHLMFSPTHSDEHIPVTIYWKTPVGDAHQREAVHRQVIEYCTQLYLERDYEGPTHCCL
jgi:hypothetical protein